jgi:predicted naringenin-chalcone synthase
LSYLLDISTAVPDYCHQQADILRYMQQNYGIGEIEMRKLGFLYRSSGIDKRYSVLDDFSALPRHVFFDEKAKSIDLRMAFYQDAALKLSLSAIEPLTKTYNISNLTHLITVSCTGMSAPGLDIQLCEALGLPKNVHRTSVNFMGCYGAIHGLKMAHWICESDPNAVVMVVATELCTLHFQHQYNEDTILSDLLFADGSAAVLVGGENHRQKGYGRKFLGFYSEIELRGKSDMAWQLSSTGFLMSLTGYIPQLIGSDFKNFVQNAANEMKIGIDEIQNWCIHPGGKKILEAIQNSIALKPEQLTYSYNTLKNYGNMSSPTVLFVLEAILLSNQNEGKIMGAAFGPGLTMESFIIC